LITADPVCADWFNSEARSDIAAKQLIIPVKRKKEQRKQEIQEKLHRKKRMDCVLGAQILWV
jgi:hypothetical protein